MRISIIIPIYNGLETTKICLKSLFFSLGQISDVVPANEFDVVVVDDGSTDGSSEWIRANYPTVKILLGDGDLWWSGGINVGAKYAIEKLKSDFIALWNNDIYPEHNYFNNLIDNIESNKDKHIFGSLVYIQGTDKIHSFGGYFNRRNGRRRAYTSFDANTLFKEVDWLPGMGTIVKSEVVVKTGYWDGNKFPQYMGDSDFILRAFNNGYKSYAFSNLVLHNNTDSTGIHSRKDLNSFIKSFYSRRSNYNIKDNFNFFMRHSKSPIALYGYLEKYGVYILSFVNSKLKKK